jgi:hypothetical protein
MRHVTGVALAVVMAVVLFFAGSWGYLKLLASPAKSGVLPAAGGSLLHQHAVLEGFGALLAVGLLAAVLAVAPAVSPLAAGLPGLALLGWTGLYLASAQRAVRYIPLRPGPFGTGFEALLFDGVLALAGLVMVVPLFVPSRWRRRPGPVSAYEATYRELGSTQAMDAVGLLDNWTATAPQPRMETGLGAQSPLPWVPAEPGPAAPPGYP